MKSQKPSSTPLITFDNFNFKADRIPMDPTRTRIEEGKRDLKILEKMIDELLVQAEKYVGYESKTLPEEAEHPASAPIYWVSKWVDYSDKYGIGEL